jgi:hypothetical protein
MKPRVLCVVAGLCCPTRVRTVSKILTSGKHPHALREMWLGQQIAYLSRLMG